MSSYLIQNSTACWSLDCQQDNLSNQWLTNSIHWIYHCICNKNPLILKPQNLKVFFNNKWGANYPVKNNNFPWCKHLILIWISYLGNVVYQVRHKGADTPLESILSEHWLIYLYYNTKAKRNELSIVELYEGYEEKNQ